jgi:motility quorum-sensing regulator/GCU-specific mRNA interferase toxin
MEKRRPNYSLKSFQAAAGDEELLFTSSALQSATKLGFSRSDINDFIQTMEDKHFYKSMTAHQSSQLWQDVCKVPSEVGLFTSSSPRKS